MFCHIQTIPPWPPFMVFVTLKRLFINSLACVFDGIYAISISNKIFIFYLYLEVLHVVLHQNTEIG